MLIHLSAVVRACVWGFAWFIYIKEVTSCEVSFHWKHYCLRKYLSWRFCILKALDMIKWIMNHSTQLYEIFWLIYFLSYYFDNSNTNQYKCLVYRYITPRIYTMEYGEDSCEEKRDTDASHYMLLQVQFKGDVC